MLKPYSNSKIPRRALGLMLLIALIACFFVIVQSCSWTDNNKAKSPLSHFAKGELRKLKFPEPNSKLPALSFKDMEGKDVSLDDFKGEIVLLNIWASWCAPCVKEMPSLSRLQKDYKNLRIIALSLDQNIKDAQGLLARKSINNLQLYHDPDLRFLPALGEASIPTSVFIDRRGKEIARIVDDIDWQDKRVSEFLDHILKNNSP